MRYDSNKKSNIMHPIRDLEERVEFLKTLKDTLIHTGGKSELSVNGSHISGTEERLEQYELAISILKSYHCEE